jgi:hypothetical protein
MSRQPRLLAAILYSPIGLAGLLAAGVLRPTNDLLRSGEAGLLEPGVFLPGSLFHVCVLNLRMNPGLFSGVAVPLLFALPTAESGWTGSRSLCNLAAISCSALTPFWSLWNV